MEASALLAENLKLKAELNLLRDILENVGSCVYVKDLNSRFTYANAKSCELLGASVDEVIGQDDSKFFAPETAAQIVKNDQLVIHSGKTHLLELTAEIKATGESRNLVATKAPLRNKQGVLIGVCGVTTDVTDQKRLEYQLAQARELLNTVLDNVNANIYLKDAEGRYLYANQSVLDTVHLSKEDILGRTDRDLFPAEFARTYEQIDNQVFASREPQSLEERFVDDAGHLRYYWSTKMLLHCSGRPDCLIGFSSDITPLKRAELAVVRSEARFRALFESSSEAVALVARDQFLDCNAAMLKLLGVPSKLEFMKLTPAELSPPQQACGTSSAVKAAELIEQAFEKGQFQFEWVVQRYDNGEQIPVEFFVTAVHLEDGPALLLTIRDLTLRKRYEAQISRLAYYDALTQLPNRRLLYERLSQAMVQQRRSNRHGCVIFLDLDNFKPLNDLHGHVAGDLLLQEVGRRLVGCLRTQDTVARLGGDEFVALLIELDPSRDVAIQQCTLVAEKIRNELARPYRLTLEEGHGVSRSVEHHCTASLGLAVFSPADSNGDNILKRADNAMYQAKAKGRNQISFGEE